MDLSSLRPAEGVIHFGNFRRDYSHGSSNGKTAGKEHKGRRVRSGAPRPGFESGQMLLYRRLPKRGFRNRNTKDIVTVNVERLGKFGNRSEVTIGSLIALGIISHARDGVKILGNGELTKRLTARVNAVSESAKAKIEAVDGTREVL